MTDNVTDKISGRLVSGKFPYKVTSITIELSGACLAYIRDPCMMVITAAADVQMIRHNDDYKDRHVFNEVFLVTNGFE